MVKLSFKYESGRKDFFIINEEAFDGKLLSKTVGDTETVLEFDNLTHIGSDAITITKDSLLTSIDGVEVPDSVTRIEADAFHSLYGKINAACVGENGLEIIGDELVACFYYGPEIELTIPEGVTVIGRKAFDRRKVKKLTLPKTVKKLEELSLSTPWLTSVKLNKGLEEMGKECLCHTALKTLTIPDTVTTIGDRAFGWCDDLTKIKFGKGVTTVGDCILDTGFELKEINGKFATEDHLGLVVDGRFVAYAVKAANESYSIPEGVTRICANAFCRSRKLKELHIPDSVTEIEPRAFSWTRIEKFTGKFTTDDHKYVIIDHRLIRFHYSERCGGPEDTLVVPEYVTEITDGACYSCGNLIDVKWHDGITIIGDQAFKGNSYMKLGGALPASLEEVGTEAFYCMDGHETNFRDGVVIPASVKRIGKSGLFTDKFWFSPVTPPVWEYDERMKVKSIFVQEDAIEAYKAAYPQYANKIQEWDC